MSSRKTVRRRALRIVQDKRHPLYMFALRPSELLAMADISRVGRSDGGELVGYQRPEVKKHVRNIVDYLNSNNGRVLFPNTIILALSSVVSFKQVRGPRIGDEEEIGEAGTLTIPLPLPSEPRPAWIVDGQQRAMALSKASRQDLPIPVSAFVADDIDTQREQFLRVNSSKPLPRGLISELLPKVDTLLPPTLAAKRIPSALCEILNTDPASPFHGLIRRSSQPAAQRKRAVVSDTALIQVLEDSISLPSGCLFTYRNIATGETDFAQVRKLLYCFWSAVREAFPDAWGLHPTKSRLMHSAGLRAMGRLMDRIMGTADLNDRALAGRVRRDLARIKNHCRWTSGTWDEIDLRWDEVQNIAGHVRLLTNHLVRIHVGTGIEA